MQSILFDTDGVLVHSRMWSEEYSRQVGINPKIMKPFFSGIFQQCIIGKADLKEVIAPFLSNWGWSGSIDEYLKSWFDFENQPDRKLIERIEALRKKGIRCYVATNQEKYRLDYLRNKMNFGNLFDGIFCSAEIGIKKPQTEFYQKIIDTLGVSPRDIAYYDDALENIESANSVGINAIYYRDIKDFSS